MILNYTLVHWFQEMLQFTKLGVHIYGLYQVASPFVNSAHGSQNWVKCTLRPSSQICVAERR